jgi:hypothetical protein
MLYNDSKEFSLKKICSQGAEVTLPPSSVGFLLSLHFDPEDGSYMFLRNISPASEYTVLQPQRR